MIVLLLASHPVVLFQDISGLPTVILQSARKEELDILMKLIDLFCLIIKHTSENRMTPNALATSCGLSFFPQFKIGEASSVMLHFIEQADAIKESLEDAVQKSPDSVTTPDSPE